MCVNVQRLSGTHTQRIIIPGEIALAPFNARALEHFNPPPSEGWVTSRAHERSRVYTGLNHNKAYPDEFGGFLGDVLVCVIFAMLLKHRMMVEAEWVIDVVESLPLRRPLFIMNVRLLMRKVCKPRASAPLTCFVRVHVFCVCSCLVCVCVCVL